MERSVPCWFRFLIYWSTR